MSIRRGGLFLQYDENGHPYPTVDDEPNGPYVLYADHEIELENTWEEAYARGYNQGRVDGGSRACAISYKHGYKQGVEAAREAVAALPKMKIAGNFPLIDADDAISAIDALLNDSSNNGTKVQGKANDEQA